MASDPTSFDTIDDTIEQLRDEFGIDIETPSPTSGSEDSSTAVTTITDSEVTHAVAPNEPVGTSHTSQITTDSEQHVTVHRRWRCPSCGYVPQHGVDAYDSGNPPELKPRCIDCGSRTCTECHASCATCDAPLCPDHSDGVSDGETTLCRVHADETRTERTFERKIEVWKQLRKDRRLELESELRHRQQWLDEQMHRHQCQMAKLSHLVDHLDRMNQLALKKWQTQFQQELARRKQMLAEYETAAKLDIKHRQQELREEVERRQLNLQEQELEHQRERHRDEMEYKHEQLDFSRLRHDDQMELRQRQQAAKEHSQLYQHRVNREQVRLNKVSTLVGAARQLDELDDSMLQRTMAQAAQGLSKSELPKIGSSPSQ